MPKKVVHSKHAPRISDGVSIRVRFVSEAQIALVKSAADRRGLGFNRYLQCVLQAVSEQVMAAPLGASLKEISEGVTLQSE